MTGKIFFFSNSNSFREFIHLQTLIAQTQKQINVLTNLILYKLTLILTLNILNKENILIKDLIVN